ncbi:MAG: RNA polymerase sigma-70 factor [Dysgonamonadaceae bacterium]|jgi:RNA polymerase sigma-70 factor (ECF subfamily)|nr:RNA polymerase sigma-70 factor [Dysgonamonadaceae bacterium]
MKINLSENIVDKSFSEIYLAYYSKLILFATEYVISEEDAENIVHDMFLFLWENRGILPAIQNRNAYLFTLIKNRCIDFLRVKMNERNRYEKIQNTFETELKLKLNSLEFFDSYHLNDENIETIITEAIDSLPEKCREVFILSRIEGLKYKDIASRLNVSVNTVENQISIALRKLRVQLKDYMPLYFFFLY